MRKKWIAMLLTVCIMASFVPCVYADSVIDTTGIYDFRDPNAISDEDFLGKYDNQQGWVIEGKFDYDSFPGMQPIKEAVMDGDYALAKAELKKYYIAKTRGYNLSYSGTGGTKNGALVAELAENQVMFDGNAGAAIHEIFSVGNQEETVRVDVLDLVNAIKAQTTKTRTLILVALKKDGSSAEFYSKETTDAMKRPALSITANGVAKRYEPIDDAYISGGSNENNNYGTEPVLKVEESVDTKNPDGAWEKSKAERYLGYEAKDRFDDEKTHQTFLTFDLNELNESDAITSATLELTGRNIAITGNTGEMKIGLFSSSQDGFEEEELTWRKKASGATNEHYVFNFNGFVDGDGMPVRYFGVPDLATKTYGAYSTSFWGIPSTLVTEFAETRDEYYGYLACKAYGDYIKTHGAEFPVYNNLCVADRLYDMSRLLDKLIESKHMTDELFCAIAKELWHKANYMRYTFTSTNNFGTFEMAGLFAVGARFQEFKDYYAWVEAPTAEDKDGIPLPDIRQGVVTIDYPLSSYRATVSQSAAFRMDVMTETMVKEDYGAVENTLGYMIVNLNNLSRVFATTATTNVEFPTPEKTRTMLKKYGHYMKDTMAPGFTDILWGDSRRAGENLRSAFYIFNGSYGAGLYDPELAWIHSEGKKGSEPVRTSVLYPDTKMAMMRTGWDEDDYFLHTSYNNKGIHAHVDDLSLIISAKGKILLSDQGTPTVYGSENHGKTSGSEAHNLIKINEQYPEGIFQHETWSLLNDVSYTGSLNDWVTNTNFDFFAATKPMLEGATFKRNVFFIKPGYWIVTDYLTPADLTSTNTYRQLWHMPPDANLTVDEASMIAKSNYPDINLQIVPVETDGLTYDIRNGTYAYGNVIASEKYVNYMKQETGIATFQTVLRPETTQENAQITAKEVVISDVLNNGASAMALQIDTNEKSTKAVYYLLNDMDQRKTRTIEGYTYDGKMFFAEEDTAGVYENMSMMEGKKLTKDGKILVQALDTVSDFSVEYSNAMIALSSSENLDLTKLTVAKQSPIHKVSFNGAEVSFNQTQNYVYFGETPIIEDEAMGETTQPTTPPPPSSNHGTGNGGGGGGGGGAAGPTKPEEPIVTPMPGEQEEIPIPGTIQKELNGHWAEEEISELFQKGYVKGDENQFLQLEANITRAELITLLVRALDLKLEEQASGFKDVADDAWYTQAIMAAYHSGIVCGYEDQTFRPDNFITREEMAKMLTGAYRIHQEAAVDDTYTYADADAQSDWAKEAIQAVTAWGFMNGRENNNFAPKANANRAEAMVVVYRILQKII